MDIWKGVCCFDLGWCQQMNLWVKPNEQRSAVSYLSLEKSPFMDCCLQRFVAPRWSTFSDECQRTESVIDRCRFNFFSRIPSTDSAEFFTIHYLQQAENFYFPPPSSHFRTKSVLSFLYFYPGDYIFILYNYIHVIDLYFFFVWWKNIQRVKIVFIISL